MNRAQTVRRYAITLIAVIFSAFCRPLPFRSFFTPMQILSSGFTGVAVLIEKSPLCFGIHFSIAGHDRAESSGGCLLFSKHIGKNS